MTGFEFLKNMFNQTVHRIRGPKAGIHRHISQRTGVRDARGRKLSPMQLRILEIMGCNLEKAFPVEK